MRLILHCCVKDEAHRYLDAFLTYHHPLVDVIHCADDRSTDDSQQVVKAHGALLSTALPVMFEENEGLFRQAAWDAMERSVIPTEEDWILTLDVDEFLVGQGIREFIELTLANAIELAIPEVWEVWNGIPQIRIDAAWGGLSAPRLFRYRPNGVFTPSLLGCGTGPEDVPNRTADFDPGVAILHFGYLDPADRMAKYNRYWPLVGVPGSRISGAHIQSLMSPPALTAWTGDIPVVYRGVRTSS